MKESLSHVTWVMNVWSWVLWFKGIFYVITQHSQAGMCKLHVLTTYSQEEIGETVVSTCDSLPFPVLFRCQLRTDSLHSPLPAAWEALGQRLPCRRSTAVCWSSCA